MSTENQKPKEETVVKTVVKPKAAPQSEGPVQISSLKARFHLVLQPTKKFEETDPDRVSITTGDVETLVHVFDPFDNVKVVPKNTTLSSKPEEIPGFFRMTLLPALRFLSEFNQVAMNGLYKVGTVKETEAMYKSLASSLLKKVDTVIPNVHGFFNKTVALTKPSNDGDVDWIIDIYAFYKYKGALVEDVLSKVETVLNTVAGVSSSGKPKKNGPINNSGLTLSVAVSIDEAYMLTGVQGLSDMKFTNSVTGSEYLPATKANRKLISYSDTEDIVPLMLFTKEAK